MCAARRTTRECFTETRLTLVTSPLSRGRAIIREPPKGAHCFLLSSRARLDVGCTHRSTVHRTVAVTHSYEPAGSDARGRHAAWLPNQRCGRSEAPVRRAGLPGGATAGVLPASSGVHGTVR